ncbi:MAG: dTDP-4-amino-4,6-dideoxygalactose transaminase [candidate division KSB1 bacterium]|nr:dTDP-4-amino-4,6-dideoxygalactose transaminase [candidate division KSB1 bacterium]
MRPTIEELQSPNSLHQTIPFNKPARVGRELEYIAEAVSRGHLAGNGLFTRRCHNFFRQRYRFTNSFLTTSGTAALEMAALLLDLKPGDEVIIPAFTFVSTANAFLLRGARIIFADSETETPNLDIGSIESLITPRTRAVVPVHYAGVACDMDRLMAVAKRHAVRIVEDAAQAVDAYYKDRPLGTFGDLAAFSFHESKNVTAGEGGLLVVNDPSLVSRAEIVWEKGTNRAAFYRNETSKYEWLDLGSSFLASELTAAFLYGQLECIEQIQQKRLHLWNLYRQGLAPLENAGKLKLPKVPAYARHNSHIFFVKTESKTERDALLRHLRQAGIHAVFHYLTLHCSPFYKDKHDGRPLPNAERWSNCLLRLPLYYELKESELAFIIDQISSFYC